MNIVEIGKLALDAAKAAGNIELQQRILELQQFALDQQEALRLEKEKNRVLEERLAEPLTFRDNCYWQGEVGPFCSSCRDDARKTVRMHDMGHGFGCPVCKSYVEDPSRPAPPLVIEPDTYESEFEREMRGL